MIRVLIIDDEPLARNLIRKYLKDETDIEIVGEAGDGAQAIALIRQLAPDLIFLDIQMPEMSGFGVIENLAVGQIPHIIFVTAYDQYALRAFEVHALDYLLKPFNKPRFRDALQHARDRLAYEPPTVMTKRIEQLLEQMQARSKYPQRIPVKEAGHVRFVRVADIDWIEAAEKYAHLHTAQKTYLIRESMKRLEEVLDPDTFCRVHRSRIVNIDRISEIQPYRKGDYVIILANGIRIFTGKKYREFIRALCNKTS
ncbi:MAG: response regulator transcription factor [Fidelibacterota bacterium]|nr:MAG: response regulator transcription factor [Candidatus Neomarinimicrobiota bacterium]